MPFVLFQGLASAAVQQEVSHDLSRLLKRKLWLSDSTRTETRP